MTDGTANRERLIRWVISDIASAFPDDHPPAWVEIIWPPDLYGGLDTESGDIRDFLAGKRWTEISPLAYKGHRSAILALITARAFHYYLPAFLTVSLTDTWEADVIPDAAFGMFKKSAESEDPGMQEYLNERIRTLSRAQLEAVANTARALSLIEGPDQTYTDAVLDIARIIREREESGIEDGSSRLRRGNTSTDRAAGPSDEKMALIRATNPILGLGSEADPV